MFTVYLYPCLYISDGLTVTLTINWVMSSATGSLEETHSDRRIRDGLLMSADRAPDMAIPYWSDYPPWRS